MKLISMTDFVTNESFGVGNSIINKEVFYDKCSNYAHFLKQLLNLGMFVPCVDNEVFNYSKHGNENEYKQAKERVLFEDVYGIEYIQNIILDRCNTIEDLLSLKIVSFELTKSAQKQLGL